MNIYVLNHILRQKYNFEFFEVKFDNVKMLANKANNHNLFLVNKIYIFQGLKSLKLKLRNF